MSNLVYITLCDTKKSRRTRKVIDIVPNMGVHNKLYLYHYAGILNVPGGRLSCAPIHHLKNHNLL